MSQNVIIPEELKAIADAKDTFATIPASAPAEPKAAKGSKLKSTPVIEPTEAEKAIQEELRKQMFIDMNLTEIENLTKLYKQYNKVEMTLKSLNDFVFNKDDSEAYNMYTITITDANRKEFKTQNAFLAENLMICLKDMLEKKRVELGEKIYNIQIKAD